MSVLGRRDSSQSGWNWSRPPSGPRRPPPSPLILLLAGGVIIAILVAIALLIVWLSDGDGGSPAVATATATPTPTLAAATSAPATPSPTATPTPAPADSESLFRLAAWDGSAWQFSPSPQVATYREGEAVPFLLRIDRAQRGDPLSITIRYDCRAFDLLTSYDRDRGSEPAQASDGPGSALADSAALIQDDPGTATDDSEGGSFSLWGGSFAGVGAPQPSSACAGEKALDLVLSAAADTLFLLWAAEIAAGAAEQGVPLRMAVQASAEEFSVEIAPESVSPAQP